MAIERKTRLLNGDTEKKILPPGTIIQHRLRTISAGKEGLFKKAEVTDIATVTLTNGKKGFPRKDVPILELRGAQVEPVVYLSRRGLNRLRAVEDKSDIGSPSFRIPEEGHGHG